MSDPLSKAATATEIAGAVMSGRVKAAAVIDATLKRIEAAEPTINAFTDVVAARARKRAAEIDAGLHRGPLIGVPFAVKNLFDIAGLPTRAGSKINVDGPKAERDGALVRKLEAAGAILVGGLNMGEYAYDFTGENAHYGPSRNPHDPTRMSGGSSGGSGAAVAAGLAPLAIGTETDGSITCPAAINGLVGLKPTVGLVSRTHIVPISHSQDTAGPMTLTVEDAAKVLTIIAGSDPADPATKEADARKTDYAASLSKTALKGVKLAVARFYTGYSPKTDSVFERALKDLEAQGATLVDVKDFDESPIGKAEGVVLYTELKADMAAYLASTDPKKVPSRTLADLIAFNKTTPKEFEWFGQESFERAEKTKGLEDPEYLKALADSKRLAGPEGIDKILKETGAVAIIAPTTGPAWTIDPLNGDNYGGSSTTLPAVAGYPHLTVPMGQVTGLPVGLSFIGPAWSEKLLLNLGYAYEQATMKRKAPTFLKTIAP